MRGILPAKKYLFWFENTAVFRGETENEAISSVDNQHWNVCHPWTYMIVDSRFVFLADLTAINSALR